ncbi:hypothetical protein AHiyo4_45800 [Arthrobacter sp. Hiyo4]|nr:hypothetical protein AHiyo4_45800 [Arthrobacter sp. Hiyo4]
MPGAPVGTNLSSFLLYSLVTSTAGRAILAALRRVKPVYNNGGQGTKALPAVVPDREQIRR